MLVVGPNPTFMDYVSHVLPSLGEESVEQRAMESSSTASSWTAPTLPRAAALKGDPRLADAVRRAAELRLQPGSGELVARMEGSLRRRRGGRGRRAARCDACELGLSLAARERFRMDVLRRFYEDYCTRLGALAVRPFEDVERALRKNGRLKRFLDEVWPTAKPEQLVSRLLSTRAALEEAAAGILDPSEQAILVRRGRAGATATSP